MLETAKKREPIRCSQCPHFKDKHPDKVDMLGNHYGICGQGGNIVYPAPRKEPRYSGKGYIKYPESTCGIYYSAEDAKENKWWNK